MFVSSPINRQTAAAVASQASKTMANQAESVKMMKRLLQVALVLLQVFISSGQSAQVFARQKALLHTSGSPQQSQTSPAHDNVVAEMQVICQSDAIVLMVNTNNPFNGMLYAKDAPDNGNCVSEFHASTNMTFRLPLRSCGTLTAEADDGIEYFNTIIVQPHMRLMTNQGKGYHIRCKYQTRERTISNTHFNVSAAFLMQNGPQAASTPLLATASMPMCTMKIYRMDQENVAESVRVGDKLVMVIDIDKQDMYGMRVTNCVVRDGMNKAEQQLISDSGCPVDESIMPKFEYHDNNTKAAVTFKAHKFPHTSSVYYQCNVRLCINHGGCEPIVCTNPTSDSLTSSATSSATPIALAPPPTQPGGPRRKRMAHGHQQQHLQQQQQDASMLPIPSELKAKNNDDMSFDVYSGLYVSDITDRAESNAGDPSAQQVLPARASDSSPASSSSSDKDRQQEACLTIGKAALLVIVASFTSVALLLLVICQAGLVSCPESSGERGLRQARSTLTSELDYTTPHQRHRSSPLTRNGRAMPSGGGGAAAKSNCGLSALRYGLGLMY